MAEEQRTGIGEGIRAGIGILNAFKEAIEETVAEAVERGDLNPDRARSVMRDAAQRVQDSLEGARERFEPISRREFELLRQEIEEVRARVARLERTDRSSGGNAEPPPFPVD